MTINVLLGLRDDAQALIVERLKWDEEVQGTYSGPVTERQHKLFGYMQDQANRQGLFRIDEIATWRWGMWSIDFDLPGNIMQKVKAEVDQLIVDYPNHIKILGAWRWSDGANIAAYPPHIRLIEFMPDIVTYDANGNETARSKPLTVSDVNLGFGQAPRQF